MRESTPFFRSGYANPNGGFLQIQLRQNTHWTISENILRKIDSPGLPLTQPSECSFRKVT